MSAQQQMRQKLDELMGTGRDGTQNPIHYSDPKVCRCFLLGLCPHEALAGTKMALGKCRKIHDYAIKADFENSSETCWPNQHRFYELTVLAYLQRVIRSCEIMDRAKKGRLSQSQAETGRAAAAEKQPELKRYVNTVDKKIAEAEELGSLGMVEESLVLIREIERLKRRRTGYLSRKSSEPVKEQKETICEECQLCIGLDNNEQRIANHLNGRLHHAMLAMRRKITELTAKLEGIKLPGDWARLELQQQMRMSSNPALVSTRARSCSPYSRSSSRSQSRSRHRSHSRTGRSYSRSRISSGSHYRRLRSRTRSKTRSRSRRRTRFRSRTESRSRTRSRSSCRPRTRSRSSSKDILRTEPTSTSWSHDRYGTNGKSTSVTRSRTKSPQGICRQQCLSVKDDAKSCSLSVSTLDESKNLLDGTGKSAGPSKKRHAQTQNTVWHMASSNASRSLNSTHRKPCCGRPQPESELTGLPGGNLGNTHPDVSFTKHNLRPKSDTRSRSKSSRSKSRSPDWKHSGSRCSKKEMMTRTRVDARDREDKSEDEDPRGSTARTGHGGEVSPGPTPDSKNRTKDLETRDKPAAGDFKTGGRISISSPAPKFKKRKVIKRNYRSRGRRSESYEESSNSTSCSEERYSRRGAQDSLRKRKTKRHKRRDSTSTSESPPRRKASKKKLARKTVTKKRKKPSSKSKKTQTKAVRKKLKKKKSVPPSPSESSSLATDTDSYEEQKSRRKRRCRSKGKMARRTSKRKLKRNESIKSRKGSRHMKRRKL